jgi:hypothetical protein
MRSSILFAVVFALSAALAAASSGCFFDDCTCPPIPARPLPQAPLDGLTVQSFDSSGQTAPLSVKPENGTIEVTGDTVVIEYRQDGVQHNVRYTVTGPRWP